MEDNQTLRINDQSESDNYTLKILSYKSTSKGKAFTINYDGTVRSFFANVEDNDNVWDPTKPVNHGCVLDLALSGTSSLSVVHGLYDAKKILVHNIAARRHRYPYLDEYDYQHIYFPTVDLKGNPIRTNLKNVILAQDTFYAIDELTTYGHCYPNSTYYEWLALDNGYPAPAPFNINTMLYQPSAVLSSSGSSGELSASISAVLHGIRYNTLYEIPGNIQQDYKSGEFIGTTVKLKNLYDRSYSMLHDEDVSLSNALSNARSYLEVCNCNDLVYLTYKDRKNYVFKSTPTAVEVSEDLSILHVDVKLCSIESDETYMLPLIEMVTDINRGAAPAKHKPSLYSLDLKTQFIDAVLNQEVRENLKAEIKNCIRSMVEKIAPANTLLFAVTVS